MSDSECLDCVDNKPFMASTSLGVLDSIATAFLVMRKMSKQNTCVNRDRKNIVVIMLGLRPKVVESRLNESWVSVALLHGCIYNDDERIELPLQDVGVIPTHGMSRRKIKLARRCPCRVSCVTLIQSAMRGLDKALCSGNLEHLASRMNSSVSRV